MMVEALDELLVKMVSLVAVVTVTPFVSQPTVPGSVVTTTVRLIGWPLAGMLAICHTSVPLMGCERE